MSIKWADIEAECGDYRDGFVAAFRKYEGQPTDEIGGNGHRVFVTINSFSRHVGIPRPTFERWVKKTTQSVSPDQQVKLDAAKARRLLADPAVANAVVDAPEARTPGTTAAKAAGNIARAAARQQERQEAASQRRDETDPVARGIDAARAQHDLTEAMDRYVRTGIDALRRIHRPGGTAAIAEALARVDEFNDEVRYLIAHGVTRIEAELAELNGGF